MENVKVIKTQLLNVYKLAVTYNIIPGKNPKPCATFPPTLSIPNVRADGTMQLVIHINTAEEEEDEEEDELHDFFFDLISEDGIETRYYKLVFHEE